MAAGAREECAVCLQDFVAEEKLRMMPCSHTFHQRCIFDWLRLGCICPLCRRAPPTQQEDDKLGCPELGATG
uniref:RING-type domain-containing protein n=1 Tax=Oryza rufipogon TaxID=4529 RepID=A0A0E0RFK3_ORYRU